MNMFIGKLQIILLSLVLVALPPSLAMSQEGEAEPAQDTGSTKTWQIDCKAGTQERQFSFDTAFVQVETRNCACGYSEEEARVMARFLLEDYRKHGESSDAWRTIYHRTMSLRDDNTTAEQTLYCYDLTELKDLMGVVPRNGADAPDEIGWDDL